MDCLKSSIELMLWGTNVCLHFGSQVILRCAPDVRQGAVSSGLALWTSPSQLRHSLGSQLAINGASLGISWSQP